ncbi:hypothetical protein [Fulvivirga sedimenti]|uniref:DoxX family membrane protein n=1 Tax=Fulvivirga sedimenti TaxID=2879465 RepID=A0A9X1HMG7_9BACT|nr:hypothetical protein [Fulvivirga sedimenti]MCA6074571.1 hypothetical protein [Fulvivirga sedimenti]MCA6075748.1 hypothetical protein [Fulvivirga sedimenti]MCA6076876.1 hypothetical protein [Fulvivirga sedimenti]
MKRIGWIALSIFYIVAGLNHFRDPEFYLPLIPGYFPNPELINLGAGIVEILLGILVAISSTRKAACWMIIILLVCFIPSHIYFIQLGGCAGKLCVPEWVAWVRLLLIHPLLIIWAYRIKNV